MWKDGNFIWVIAIIFYIIFGVDLWLSDRDPENRSGGSGWTNT